MQKQNPGPHRRKKTMLTVVRTTSIVKDHALAVLEAEPKVKYHVLAVLRTEPRVKNNVEVSRNVYIVFFNYKKCNDSCDSILVCINILKTLVV
jgi:hypothetical protein